MDNQVARLRRFCVLFGICLFILFSSTTATVNAAVVFSEGFESGGGDWSVDNGVWQVGVPTAGPVSCYEGTQCAGTELDGNYGANTDSRLVSPTIDLPLLSFVGEEVHLRFWNWFSYSIWGPDNGRVQVQVWDDATSTWGNWVTEGIAVADTSDWSLKDVDLTAYAGEMVRLGFYHTASDYGSIIDPDVSTGWYIDAISIVTKIPELSGDFETGWDDWGTDRGVWQVGVPTAGPVSCYEGTQCAGTELDGNYGANTDSRLVSPTIDLPLLSFVGEEVHLRFWNWFSYSILDNGRVQVQVWDDATSTWGNWINEGIAVADTSGWSLKDVDLTAYAGETVRLGFYHMASDYGSIIDPDVSTGWYIDAISIVTKIPELSGDFETGWDDWGTDRGVWQVGVPTAGPVSCYEGTQCAGTELDGNYGANTDSRLVSPTIDLPLLSFVGEEVHLRFWNWFSYSILDNGRVQVQVWDDATSTWGNWVTEGIAVADTSDWSLKDVDLTAYAGEMVRLGFYHIASDYGSIIDPDVSTGWYIDAISIVTKIPELSGDFETGWDDWGTDRGVWQVGVPTAGPVSCYEGTQCAGTELDGNYGANTDSRLVSPTIDLPLLSFVGEEVHLRFWNWFSYSILDNGRVQVQVWDDATSTWGNWINEGIAVADTSGWSLKDVDLTAYAGETVRLGFYHMASDYGSIIDPDVSTGWYIDAISIVTKIPELSGDFETGWDDWGTDRGVWQVGVPTAGPVSCYEGTQCAGTELDGNYGANTDSRLVSPTIDLPLLSFVGEEVHLRFWNWFSYSIWGPDNGRVQVQVWDDATSTWGNWVTEGIAVADTSDWSLKDVDLTVYAGEMVRLGFYHIALDYGSIIDPDVSTGWYIDAISITGFDPCSINPTGIGCPAGDDDGDGVTNDTDQCSDTPAGEIVDVNGCSACQVDPFGIGCPAGDDDGDGATNDDDLCSDTPAGESVDADGCSACQLDPIGIGCPAGDDDSDGVTNDTDLCSDSPAGEIVDVNGCSACQFDPFGIGCPAGDDDGDGVTNDDDQCSDTPAGESVDINGCSACQLDPIGIGCPAGDDDGDGVTNHDDLCSDTPAGESVDADGCSACQLDPTGIGCTAGDDDNDGVINDADLCPETLPGEIVDPGTGCSIDQLNPCDGPWGTHVSWRNHGHYVSSVAKTAESFMDLGLITGAEKDAIVSSAAQSSCGDKK